MLQFNFSPFPVLETERLILRRIVPGDVNEIFTMRSDPETMQYIPRPLARTLEDALEHIAVIDRAIESNEGINWALTQKGNDRLMGIIGFYRAQPHNFRAEIGYMVLPEFSGKGFTSEAIEKVVEYGFETLQLHSIEAVIDPENFASARVLEKNRFVKEARFRQNEFYEGRFLDTVVYGRLKTD